MSDKPTLQLALKKVQSLKDRFERLEKDVGALKDLLNVHDNWHSTVRKWIGEMVIISTRSGTVTGRLRWTDRYNLCVEVLAKLRIYTKGGIDWIEPAT